MLEISSSCAELCHLTCALGLLAASLDELAQIADWQGDGEVDRLKDHRKPEVPSHQRGNEREGASSDSASCAESQVAISSGIVGSSQQWERDDEADQNYDQANVRAKSCDRVEDAENALDHVSLASLWHVGCTYHPNQEHGEAAVECCSALCSGSVPVDSVEGGSEGCSECTPETSEGEEDDCWEGVAQDPLSNTTSVEQDRSQEIECADTSTSISSASSSTSPTHQLNGSWCVGQQEAAKGNWCGIGECPSKVTSNWCLWSKVQLSVVSISSPRTVGCAVVVAYLLEL